jgi:Fe-S cluster biogenesis protein NfuA
MNRYYIFGREDAETGGKTGILLLGEIPIVQGSGIRDSGEPVALFPEKSGKVSPTGTGGTQCRGKAECQLSAHTKVNITNDRKYLIKAYEAIRSVEKALRRSGLTWSPTGRYLREEITNDMVLRVEMKGACNGCPFSMQTLKAGVEMAIRNEVPEIRQVVDVNMP